MKSLILTVLFFLTGHTFASEECSPFLNQNIESAQVRPLTFKNVEVFRRNNNVGLQQVGEIKLTKWIELTLEGHQIESFLGLDEKGRLYHLAKLKGRTLARILNGKISFKDFYIIDRQMLVGVDFKNSVQLFAPHLWLRSPKGSHFRKSVLIWGGSTAAFIVGLQSGFHFQLPELLMVSGFVGISTGMTSVFSFLRNFENSNTFPNGFIRASILFESEDALKDQVGQINIDHLSTYLFRDHFDPPLIQEMFPLVPETAQEEIH